METKLISELKNGLGFAQSRGEVADDTFAKEEAERILKTKIERNLFKEHPDLQAGHRMISFPYRGQAWHPNFDTEV